MVLTVQTAWKVQWCCVQDQWWHSQTMHHPRAGVDAVVRACWLSLMQALPHKRDCWALEILHDAPCVVKVSGALILKALGRESPVEDIAKH